MKRRLMQLLFALGLLLTLAAGTLWVRAFWAYDSLELWTGYRDGKDEVVRVNAQLSACGGHLGFRWTEYRGLRGEPFDATWFHTRVRYAIYDPSQLRLTAKFEYTSQDFGAADAAQSMGEIPIWFAFVMAVALTAVPGTFLRHARRCRMRVAIGLCGTCGYDLRGADHERCPECGAPVAAAAV